MNNLLTLIFFSLLNLLLFLFVDNLSIKFFHKLHLNFLKVKAVTFDPNNHFDISKKIIHTLKLSKRKKNQMVFTSKKNINNYSWKNVVNNYYNLIKKLRKNE